VSCMQCGNFMLKTPSFRAEFRIFRKRDDILVIDQRERLGKDERGTMKKSKDSNVVKKMNFSL
jgi:hypothetical protein